jgi:hypothetical protein
MVEITLHDGGKFDFKSLNASDCGDSFFATETVDMEFAVVDVCDIVVFEEEDSFGVFDDGGRVGCEEKFDGNGDTVFGEEGSRLGAVEMGFH